MIDLEAIRKHLEKEEKYSLGFPDCDACIENQKGLIVEVERLRESACPCCQESDSIRAYLERKAVNLAAKQTDETDKP